MTEFHALDLSGDRAALHRWDGRGWTPVGTAPIQAATGDAGRALADLLVPVAGMAVAVALPTDRITVVDMPDPADAADPAATDPPSGARTDWIALPGGGWRRMSVPDSALAEIDVFLDALGVRCAGCMAAAGGDLPPAWFGTADSPVRDGRATDRPRCLGPARPGPHDRIAVARLRAHAVAARNPAHLIPLPEPATTPEASAQGPGFRVPALHRAPSRRVGMAVVGALLLAAVAAGLSGWQGGADRGPTARAPDVTALATAPAPGPDLARPGPKAAGAAPVRALAPRLDRDATMTPPATSPGPSQQASLSAMDAPPGMEAAATFYSPPYLLAVAAAPGDHTRLTIPGLDPVFRTDALALPDARQPDPGPAARRTLNAPGSPEQTFVVDDRGLIRPSPEGRASPDGFTVVAGLPPAAVRPRPARPLEDVVRVMRRADLAADDPLRQLLPRLRPNGLAERRERTRLGGRTAGELAGFAPQQRPDSAQDRAGPGVAVTPAIVAGPRPEPRTAAALARATAAPATGPAIAAADVARVAAPTSNTVAERATTRVSIDLSQINLLGTFGAGNGRRALVRLPSGRVVNLSVGDRVDGGRVQSIGDGQLGYVKSGRTVMLAMPRG